MLRSAETPADRDEWLKVVGQKRMMILNPVRRMRSGIGFADVQKVGGRPCGNHCSDRAGGTGSLPDMDSAEMSAKRALHEVT